MPLLVDPASLPPRPERKSPRDQLAEWSRVAEADGWEDVPASKMFAAAVDGIAWALIDATMDTADREPGPDIYRDAVETAMRVLAAVKAEAEARGRREVAERVVSREWAERFLDEWRRPYFGDDSRDAVAAVMRATAAAECQCPPCPGRGNDGHRMSHCAECCFGTGVEADEDCPKHGRAALPPVAPAPTESPGSL